MIVTDSAKCPFCGNPNGDVQFSEFQVWRNEAYQEFECTKCGKKGVIVYEYRGHEWEENQD